MLKKGIACIFLLFTFSIGSFAQEEVSPADSTETGNEEISRIVSSEQDKEETLNVDMFLTLDDVINMALQQSSSIKYVQNQNVNYYWRWRNFKSRFRPRLSVSGDLPDYQQVTTPVTQPDGSIKFQQIQQLSTNARLALSQTIPQTGTTISAATSMFRIQDYIFETIEWSGSPFYVSFYQPLFAYNWMKWARKTEPLIYEESQKNFVENIEEVSLEAANRFFRYLRVKTDYNLSGNNLKNSKVNLKIAEVKKAGSNI